MGSWLSYGLGSENKNLPSFVVLISRGSAARPADPEYAAARPKLARQCEVQLSYAIEVDDGGTVNSRELVRIQLLLNRAHRRADEMSAVTRVHADVVAG